MCFIINFLNIPGEKDEPVMVDILQENVKPKLALGNEIFPVRITCHKLGDIHSYFYTLNIKLLKIIAV